MFISLEHLLSAAPDQLQAAEAVEPVEWQNNDACGIRILNDWLNAEELSALRAFAERADFVRGEVSEGASSARQSACAWLDLSAETHWLYKKLAHAFMEANAHYGFDIRAMNEEPQLLHYAAGGHIGWHHDVGVGGASVRKLALVALISQSAAIEGGQIEFSGVPGRHFLQIPGTAIVFPPFLSHRVTPLLAGERLSLVSWACGPAFR